MRGTLQSCDICISINHDFLTSWARAVVGIVLFFGCVVILEGCTAPPALPQTPNLYSSHENPFESVPVHLRTSEVGLLYATDRMQIVDEESIDVQYGSMRSESLAFGRCVVKLGDGLDWNTIVEVSLDPNESTDILLNVVSIEELIRFPSSVTPPVKVDGRFVRDPAVVAEQQEKDTQVLAIISKQLAESSSNEINVFVHGINNNFEDSMFRMAQLWHMSGRDGVPIVYTWPANPKLGPLRGYTHDRESGEFTVYHLRKFIQLISQCPDLMQLNIIAHSRGTDIAMTALRELQLQSVARGSSLQEDLKLGNVVLVAPDIDLGVSMQRLLPDFVHLAPKRLTMYVSEKDKAIGIAEWLFSSLGRLGKLRSDRLPMEKNGAIRSGLIDVIDVKTSSRGAFGHTYFIDNPAVLSDLILLLRDDRDPGIENGRPLVKTESGFWNLYDGYPYEGLHKGQDVDLQGEKCSESLIVGSMEMLESTD